MANDKAKQEGGDKAADKTADDALKAAAEGRQAAEREANELREQLAEAKHGKAQAELKAQGLEADLGALERDATAEVKMLRGELERVGGQLASTNARPNDSMDDGAATRSRGEPRALRPGTSKVVAKTTVLHGGMAYYAGHEFVMPTDEAKKKVARNQIKILESQQ